jgi:hypothetical protein
MLCPELQELSDRTTRFFELTSELVKAIGSEVYDDDDERTLRAAIAKVKENKL